MRADRRAVAISGVLAAVTGLGLVGPAAGAAPAPPDPAASGPGVAASGTAAAPPPTPAVDVLAVTGTDHQLWVRRSTEIGYRSLGGYLVGTPAVTVDPATGTPYYVGQGPNGRIYVRTDELGWRALVAAGDCTEPDAAVGEGVLSVGCRGTDGRLYVAQAPLAQGLPSAAGWRNYGGALLGGPSLTASGASVEYVVRGTNDVVYARTDTSGFRSRGTSCSGPPEQAVAGTATVLACRAADGSLRYQVQDAGGAWSAGVAGQLVGRPAVDLAPDGSGTFWVIGTDARIYRSPLSTAGTVGQFSLAPGSGSGLSATRFAGDPVLVAAGDIACDPADPSFNAGKGVPDRCRQASTAALAASLGPSVVAPLGDEQYAAGRAAAFAASYDPTWGRLLHVTRPAVGNHEYGTPGAAGYFDYFGPRAGDRSRGWYSYDVGSWHVVALNSNCTVVACGRGSEQEQWLRADLAASPRRCTLAYWHHPRFSSGAHGDNPATAPFWQALSDAHADVVLAGHDHTYERFDPLRADGTTGADGLRSFVVGTGGKEHYTFRSVKSGSVVRNEADFGVLALTLGADGYTWQFRTEAGGTADVGAASCRA